MGERTDSKVVLGITFNTPGLCWSKINTNVTRRKSEARAISFLDPIPAGKGPCSWSSRYAGEESAIWAEGRNFRYEACWGTVDPRIEILPIATVRRTFSSRIPHSEALWKPFEGDRQDVHAVGRIYYSEGEIEAIQSMNQKDSTIQWSLLLASVVAILLASGGCEHRTRSGEPVGLDTTRGPVPKHVSWDAEFTLSREGHRRAVLAARRMEQYKTSDSSYSVWRTMSDTGRVRAYLFDQEGDSSATLTADSVVYQNQKGQLDAYGNVVVVTESNKRLESEKLTWRQADRTIRTRRFVRIVTPKEVVQGNGLVADEDLESYQIGRFTAEVEVDEEDEP